MEFGKLLAVRRKNSELTQQQVGNHLRIAYQMVGHWEQGRSKITLFEFCRLRQIYPDLSFADVLEIWRRVGDQKDI